MAMACFFLTFVGFNSNGFAAGERLEVLTITFPIPQIVRNVTQCRDAVNVAQNADEARKAVT